MVLNVNISLVDSYEMRFKLERNLKVINEVLNRCQFHQDILKDVNITAFIVYIKDSFESENLNNRINWIYCFSKIILHKISKKYLQYVRKFNDETIFENYDLKQKIFEIDTLCEKIYYKTNFSEDIVLKLLKEIETLNDISKFIEFTDHPTEDSSSIFKKIDDIVNSLRCIANTDLVLIDCDTYISIIREIKSLNHLLDYWKTSRDIEKTLGLIYY